MHQDVTKWCKIYIFLIRRLSAAGADSQAAGQHYNSNCKELVERSRECGVYLGGVPIFSYTMCLRGLLYYLSPARKQVPTNAGLVCAPSSEGGKSIQSLLEVFSC